MSQVEHLTRQLDIIPIEVLPTPITIIGAGAVGGWVTLALAKMGFENIHVFDFDEVSIENMNSQFYRFSDIGTPKVDALADLVMDFTQTQISVGNHPWPSPETKVPTGIVISAVDSMKARRAIWDEVKTKPWGIKKFIDPRMGAENILLYAVNPNDPESVKAYETTLYSDENAVEERCTAKATMYTVSLISGLVTKAVKDSLVSTSGGTQNKSAGWLKTVLWDVGKNHCLLYSQKEA